MPLPILYSLQQCPYAIRARLGLIQADQPVIIRTVKMKALPKEMLTASPKGTVPVLILNAAVVIDESLDIMLWALKQNDPKNLLLKDDKETERAMRKIINRHDFEFIEQLEEYKRAHRYHDGNKVSLRQQCEHFIADLELKLSCNNFLLGPQPSLADYVVLPFIRQFSRVERQWYLSSPYPNLRHWLNTLYQDPLYAKAMKKYPQWSENHDDTIFNRD